MSEGLRERIAEISHADHCSVWVSEQSPCSACFTKADRILALLDDQEPVAHAVMADGHVLAANRNVALLESDRARLVRAFPDKDFTPGLVPLYTRAEEPTR